MGQRMPTSDDRPIRVLYVFGTGHCGSTILSFVLDTHPKIICLGEAKPNVKIQRRNPQDFSCSCGLTVSQCPFWQQLFELVQQQGLRFSADDWTNDYRYRNRLLNRLFETRLALRFDSVASRLPGHRGRNRRIDDVNVASMQAALELSGRVVFADASKREGRLTRLLSLPSLDVKVLHLIRDVRAFVCSHKRRGISVREASLWWRRTQEFGLRLRRKLRADQYLPVRYEDFGRDAQAALDEISSFLELAPAPLPEVIDPTEHHILGNRIRLGGPLQVSTDEKWRRELTRQDVREAFGVAGDVNAGFGYSPDL